MKMKREIEITQPMKQAYREIYVVTDAELATRSYSNRMAAHILKQHQFSALAGGRTPNDARHRWVSGRRGSFGGRERRRLEALGSPSA